jgi:hypothetical protein
LQDFYRKGDMFSMGIVVYCMMILSPHPPKKMNFC